MAKSLTFTRDTLTPGLKNFPDAFDHRMQVFTHFYAQHAEDHMKKNAPWTDRTSNARNGLRARPNIALNQKYEIILMHGVPYGIWLEIRFEGKNAIIIPTLKFVGREIMISLRVLLRSMR